MERSVGIEEARGRLGELVERVAESGDAVVLCRRGVARAILVDRQEYLRFKVARNAEMRAELERLLTRIEAQVVGAGLDAGAVAEAIHAARSLD